MILVLTFKFDNKFLYEFYLGTARFVIERGYFVFEVGIAKTETVAMG